MTKIDEKKTKKAKKNLVKVALFGTLGGIGINHFGSPTTLPELYYSVTDSFTTTPTEKKIEENFGIDYEGDPNEERQKELEDILHQIYDNNPKLLTYCKKIVLHSEAVKNSSLVKPFLSYNGLSYNGYAEGLLGTINIINLSVGTIAHELAHLKDYHAPKEFHEQLDRIFGDSYKKDLKDGKIEVWNDDSTEPRNGFVVPYGANSPSENVATYIGRSYSPQFWEDEQLHQSDKYLRTLTLLAKYDFISPKQFKEIKETLENNPPLTKLFKILNQDVQEKISTKK
ncbi:MAG: hypothetical protein Q8R47_00565 [Nanoarchaeota archaeon]|nr:hypothetical protein [Nanoarchaeota archaeon]